MSQLRPNIYLSINSSARQPLSEALHRQFAETTLARLRFNLCWSPRGEATSENTIEQLEPICRASTVLLQVLDQDMLNEQTTSLGRLELGWAQTTPGCILLMVKPDNVELSEPLRRQLYSQGITPLTLNTNEHHAAASATLLLETLSSRLGAKAEDLPTASQQVEFPTVSDAPWPTLREQILSGKAPDTEPASPLSSDMMVLKQWALSNLELGNQQGAEKLLRRCIDNNDVDLFANFQLVTLLKGKANDEQDIDEQEFCQRIDWVLKQLPHDEPSRIFRAQLLGWQANSLTRCGQYDQAHEQLVAANEQLESADLLTALLHNGLSGIEAGTFEHKRDILLQCKQALYRCLCLGLPTFQSVITQLSSRVSPKALGLVIHGLRHDVVAQLEPLLTLEKTLFQEAEQQRLLAAGQQRNWDRDRLRQLSLWNLQQLAFYTARRQLSVLQKLAGQLQQQLEMLEQRETKHQAAQHQYQQQQQLLNTQQQQYLDASTSRKQASIQLSLMLVLALATTSALFWAPWNPLFTAGTFVALVLVLAFIGYRWFAAREQMLGALHQVQQSITNSDGPMPRQAEGWFDRLAIQLSSQQTQLEQNQQSLNEDEQQLQLATQTFMNHVNAFEQHLLSPVAQQFCPWTTAGDIQRVAAAQAGPLLPEPLAARMPGDTTTAEQVLAQAGTEGYHRVQLYFTDTPLVTGLHWLSPEQEIGNSSSRFHEIRAPLLSSDSDDPVLEKWLVQSGDTIAVDQPLAELLVGDHSLTLHSDCAGEVVAYLVNASHSLHPEQPLVRVRLQEPTVQQERLH